MASDEQFSLCWNNFHANMSAGFHGLLSRGDLVDVTLAAEGRLLQAHKLVLSVCSPFFQEMFKMNPTQHPIVFLKDVSHSALRDLLQFMYQGEVNVKQEELASFISTAEQLQVKGLTGNQNEESSTPSKPKPTSRPGPRSSQQRQSVMTKLETDLDSKPSSTPVAVKRPNRPSIASNNSSSSQSGGPVKRKCVDPLEAGPSGSAKDEFVTIPDEDENNAVAPKMEPEFVNESMWDDDDDGTNNDETNFGEDDSNMEMSGFDGSATGDGTLTGTGEGAVGDAQVTDVLKLDWVLIYFTKLDEDKLYRCNVCQAIMECESEETKAEIMVDHIQQGHKEIYELHKDNPEETVGFRIEFLHLNVLNEEDKSQQVMEVLEEESAEKQVEEIQGDENVQFVLMSEAEPTPVKPVKREKPPRVSAARSGGKLKRSWVWKYFEKISSVIFRCNLCNVVLSIKGNNTNNMNRHVKSKHPVIYKTEMMSATYTRRKDQAQLTDVACEVEIPVVKAEAVASTPKARAKATPDAATRLARRSWIWTYFTRLSGTLAQCKLCNRKINHGGNATGNMNRHLKYLHKHVYDNSVVEADKTDIEDVAWVWKLFTLDEDSCYACKICNFKCIKFEAIDKSVQFILEHLRSEHGVISGSQIISGSDCDAPDMDECTVAVDFLKGAEM
ncbi:uncharacterized protein LOC105388802 [Plutella xylostella]|uniref:uncharacterized protein LOC105388802 n=1 Tax=Plutella xylostella TaxID=51655 RepID=UPI002032B82B|nr:uncharacterized protein LOC105388802 [Plutella xylostella]